MNELHRQTGSLLSELLFAIAVIWHHLIDFVPEGFAVVAVMAVAKFMDYDVVNNFKRCHHAFPVKV
ncbi:MAG: hypothetical protein VKJ46_11515 [Leptolyngbyaceae bacterium]|nr:hypothetical protein [Leptolyngbyaceae bacterium]